MPNNWVLGMVEVTVVVILGKYLSFAYSDP